MLIGMLPGNPLEHQLGRGPIWFQFALATPVVLWAGWPLFERGWMSFVHRSLNMFTLIAMGAGTAYVYSVFAALIPGIFPGSFRTHHGDVPVYFEPAAVIVTFVLLGQVLELRARAQTGAAIRALVELAPKTARVVDRGRIRTGRAARIRPHRTAGPHPARREDSGGWRDRGGKQLR